jgi:hypothetical protein
MKKAFLFLILAAFGLSASQCERKDCCILPPCSDTPTLTGVWVLEGYQHLSTGVPDNITPDADKNVVFNFRDDEMKGTIEGNTFVNTIQGTYELQGDCRIKVITFGGTKVGEPEWSAKAWLASETIYPYEKTGNTLKIYINQGTEVMIFKKRVFL